MKNPLNQIERLEALIKQEQEITQDQTRTLLTNLRNELIDTLKNEVDSTKQNIKSEMATDIIAIQSRPNLINWACMALLLGTILTTLFGLSIYVGKQIQHKMNMQIKMEQGLIHTQMKLCGKEKRLCIPIDESAQKENQYRVIQGF